MPFLNNFESKSLREALAAEEYWYAWKKQQQEEKADVDEWYHHIFDYGFSKYDSPQVTAHFWAAYAYVFYCWKCDAVP